VAAAAALSVAVGARTIPLATTVQAVLAFDPGIEDHVVISELRLPRTAIVLAVGAALGLAGALMQGLTRNPLADPGLLGVNAGAALAVVAAAALGWSTGSTRVWFALAGAALAGALVTTIGSSGRGGATAVKLAVAGAACSALLGSVTAALVNLDAAALDQYRFWVAGSVAGRDLDALATVAPFLVAGLVLGLASARALDGMALGDDVARSLGLPVAGARAVAATAVVLLCGAATAVAGPIWFVGLAVPHLARRLTGPDHRWLLPASLLLGAVLLTVADVVGRVVVRPGELEVGIVTALLGAPLFIAFVRRPRLAAL